MNIFLAFAFRDEDKDLVSDIKQLLVSHGVQINSGETLGGEELTPAVKEEIDNSHALIAVLTGRDRLSGGGWITHQWVVDELNYAHEKKKMAIALLEEGTVLKGMAVSHQHIPLNKEKPIKAILELSQTIGKWKSKVGRTLKFQVLPKSLADQLANGTLKCKYRLWAKGNTKSEWEDAKEARISPEDFATFVYVDGVQDDQLVQLKVEAHGMGADWLSPAKAQWMQIELSEKKPEQQK